MSGPDFIEKTLVLSTGHVPSENPNFGNLRAESFEYGWVVWVTTYDPAYDPKSCLPDWLDPAWKFAKLQKCTLIVFDRDGATLEHLPKWDW